MTIKINHAKLQQNQSGSVIHRFYRTCVRYEDESGFFKLMKADLDEIAEDYSLDFDTVSDYFAGCNTDIKRLRDYLEKRSFTKWSDMEDYVLEKASADDPAMIALTKKMGEKEISRRRKYLNLVD